ncbi:MAG: tRNA lysidine(34) synthetase TilS [Pseudomonadota bacterium]
MSRDPVETHVDAALSRHFGRGDRIGVAVSGGSDSVALMQLAALWAQNAGAELQVATVDHGLREGSMTEAATVREAALSLSLKHTVLSWTGWDGTGNLQDAAREARRRLLAQWAREQNLVAVLLGHTLQDQAETFLMRLGRGSGVDGLAAMSEARTVDGVTWLRPMLGLSRTALQDWLRARDVSWVEDPSNEDERFARVRIRKAAGLLSDLGLDAPRIAATAASMARARQALLARAYEKAELLAEVTEGVLTFEANGLARLDAETRLRLLAHGLQWTAHQAYKPRLSSLETVWTQVQGGAPATLHGCILGRYGSRIFIAREYAPVAQHIVPDSEIWDARWRFSIEGFPTKIAALGDDGLRTLGSNASQLPRGAILALPGLWAEGELVAVPSLSWGQSVNVHVFPAKTSFLEGLIAH